MAQLYWEDVTEGAPLPPLTKTVSPRQLVKYAGVSGDYSEAHYDAEYCRRAGLPGVIVHGALKSAFIAQMVVEWMGEGGTLRKFGVQYRGMDVPGDQLTCRGRVTRKYRDADWGMVDLEVWLENSKGEKTTPGHATVELPLRDHT